MSNVAKQSNPKQEMARQLAQRFVALPHAQREKFIAQIAEKGWDFQRLPLVRFPDDEIVPLTLAQRRLWFLWKMSPDSHAYNLSGALRWRGRLDRAILENALLQVLQRHSALRTRFIGTADGDAEQCIEPVEEISLHVDDVNDFSSALTRAENFTQKPFDLERDLPFRAGLIRIAEDDHLLWISVHHIAADGWSMQWVLDDLLEIYRNGNAEKLTIEQQEYLDYRDYACWQRYALTPAEMNRQLAYWRAIHTGDNEPLSLPMDKPRAAVQSLRGARYAFQFNREVTAKVREHARESGVTLFVWLLTAYQILLYRLSGQADLRIGIASAGRHRPETEKLVGFFVGTQVLRLPIEGKNRFDALLKAARIAADGAQLHPDLPFDRLVEALAPERDLSRNPLFQAKFTQQIALPTRIALSDAEIELLTLADASTHFDLGLDITDRGDTIDAVFTYDSELFTAESVAIWGEHICAIADFFSARPTACIADWQVQGSVFTQGEMVSPPWRSVLQAWQQQVAVQPDALALRCEDKQWTRGEIENAATQLAQILIARGTHIGNRIALCCARSSALVIGILAVWKARATYVPLDFKQPPERLRWVIEDAQTSFVIVDDEGEAVLREHDKNSQITLIRFDAREKFLPPLITGDIPAQLPAYVIYTSGSTGRPKGVVVDHAALAHYTAGLLHRISAHPSASFAMVSTVAADLGHTTLFGALADGRLLHLISAERAFDPDRFAEYMAEHHVGVLKIVPSHLQGLLQAAQPADVLPKHVLIVGGETTPPALLKKIHELAPACRIVNHYGPTETTVGVLTEEAFIDGEKFIDSKILPLGRALPCVEAWILDADLNSVPAGVTGELYLGGPQLAQYYTRKPALSAERFVPHPFAHGQRLYRSGDAAKHLRDGRIVFCGRRDDQVKIRGYRVELREIAAQILTLSNCIAAEVSVRDIEGHPQLLAWVTPADIEPLALKSALASNLPDYMVPAHILPLAAMPLTTNGKLDRAALPLPQRIAAIKSGEPRTDAERTLLSIWQSVLNFDDIGIDDNFFSLGGDSILSLQVIARARKSGLRLMPKQLFEHQTIAELAAVAVQVEAKSNDTIAKDTAPIAAAFALTPIQCHFFSLPIANRNHWNQSLLLAPREKLNAQRLRDALVCVADCHPALRTQFIQSTDWQQKIANSSPLFSARFVTDNDDLLAACESVQRSLDIQRGQLFAALLAELPDGTQRLLLCAHHLVIDGVSWRIVLEDLSAAYRQSQRSLLAPSLSISAWSLRLQQLKAEPELLAEYDYWRNAAQASSSAVDGATNPVSIAEARHYKFSLSQESTHKLQAAARTFYNARGDELLIAAFVWAMAQTADSIEPLCLWLEHHGRDLDGVDASRCVGWFTSIYPALLTVGNSLVNTVNIGQKVLRAVPRHGIGFGVLRYLLDDKALQFARPAIVFNHLGRFDNSLGVDALFDIAAESGGSERDPNAPLTTPLTLVSRELGGILHFDWIYSAQHYADEFIEQLANCYLAALTELSHAADRISESQIHTSQTYESREVARDINTESLANRYPTAPIQQGLLFHAQLAPQSSAYINQLSMTFTDLDSERFIAAWRRAIARHDILRTAFEGAGADAYQRVYREVELPLCVLDWREQFNQANHQAEQKRWLEQLVESEKNHRFEFGEPPLMRLVLVRLSDRDTHFIWTRHHVLLDGWSTARLLSEIIDDYAGLTIAVPHLRFRDHIDWLAQRDTQAEQVFWQGQLRELDEPTLLAPSLKKYNEDEGHALYGVVIDSDDTQKLIDFARAQRVTLNTVVQGAWGVLLGRYCGKRTICFGVTVAGRPAELDGIDSVLGLFINTLPLICHLDPAQSVAQFLRVLQTHNAELREFEQMPLAEIQRRHGGELFDSLLVFENFPLTQHAAAAINYRDVNVDESTHYALTLVVEPGAELRLRFDHDRGRIDTIAVQQLAEHLRSMLITMTANADAILGALVLPAPPSQWNATRRNWDTVIPVHEAIRRQSLHSPHAVALAMDSRVMSYAELDRIANDWAQHLFNAGVRNESIVAIAAERSFELVIGLLAILKTGAAYLPIDPDYPVDRIAYMLADAKPTLLLTQSYLQTGHLQTRFRDIPVLMLDDAVPSAKSSVNTSVHALQLAYLIYTSGSTGKPKGAGNTHGALCNRLAWMQDAYAIGAGNRVLQKTPIGFDVSVWEFFWPLMTGATLVLAAPHVHRDPQALIETICQQRIDTLHFVPSMLQVLLMNPDVEHCESLRQIICSGEALPAEVQNELLTRLPNARLYNLYGPTEAAIDVTHWACAIDDALVPIGAPIANTQIHILDADLNPLPAGIAGELYIGGVNLARGYLGRFGLTAERFVPNPFTHGERLYRSGDLARWRSDGNIEYLGRLDHQIKLRGQRIELGEIETALRACEGVRDAVVIARTTVTGRQLAAYVVVGNSDSDFAAMDWRAALKKVLPDYMVPATLTSLDALPLSPNGKLDRNALPAPEIEQEIWQPPQTELEKRFASQWQTLLNCERVGRDAQFFALGGHSLLAAQWVATLRSELNITVPLKQIFDTPVLSDFAAAVESLRAGVLDANKVDAIDDLLSELEV